MMGVADSHFLLGKDAHSWSLAPLVLSDWGIVCLRWDMLLGLHSRKGPFWLRFENGTKEPMGLVTLLLVGRWSGLGRPLRQGQGSLLHDGSGTKTKPTEALKRCC